MTTTNDYTCPSCGNHDQGAIILVEYDGRSPYHYDGISELWCQKCHARWGRWSGRLLADDEVSTRKGHVKVGKDEQIKVGR